MAARIGQKKVGGRQKGTPNKRTAKREAEIAASGKTPLQFLIDRMRKRVSAATPPADDRAALIRAAYAMELGHGWPAGDRAEAA